MFGGEVQAPRRIYDAFGDNRSDKMTLSFAAFWQGSCTPVLLPGSCFLLFLTFLSANLAVVNFLPIPILDGGHMLFLAYEGIFRRPVSERVQVVLTYGGLFMILGLMLFVIFLDIGRIVSL